MLIFVELQVADSSAIPEKLRAEPQRRCILLAAKG
jgi:hypothetical protein